MKQSAHAIILSPCRTKVLLVKRRDVPVWVLPGGGIEGGETPLSAAQREGEEETGLDLREPAPVGISHPRNALSNISHLYQFIADGAGSVTEETRDVQWFPLTKLPTMPPPYPEWIHDMATLQLPFEKQVVSVNYWAFIKHLVLHPILMFRFLLARLGVPVNR